MRILKILTIACAASACLLPATPVLALSMPWETRPQIAPAPAVPQPGPEWDAIFPKGFSFDIPRSPASAQRERTLALPLERFDRLRVNSNGSPANELDYVTNVLQLLLSVSTDDILRNPDRTAYRVNYDERLRFFLGPAWRPYELYMITQKNRLAPLIEGARRLQAAGARTSADLIPDSRKLTFADGRGSFTAEGWLSDGVYGKGTRSQSFVLKIDFITDRASPDIIISKWDMTIQDNNK
jgi:hypothetical protein